MDLQQVIEELYERKRHLDRVIAALEELQNARPRGPYNEPAGPRRRGRKFMDTQERREVSERMKKYWSDRRAQISEASKPKAGAAISSGGGELPPDNRS